LGVQPPNPLAIQTLERRKWTDTV